MNKVFRPIAAATVLMMAALAGPVEAQDKLKATAVTPLGYLLAYTGMLYGEGGGFMADAGLDLTVQAAQGSAQGIQLVLSGQALVARGAGIDAMIAIANRNVPVVAIGTIAHIAPLQIISSAANPIRGPKDMVGKTIGVASVGGASEQTLLLMLATEGVDPNTVTRQVVGPSAGSFGLVQGGQVHAFVGTNAAVAELTARNVPFHHFATHDVLPVPGQVYITSRENLTSKTEELVRFLRGAQAAVKDAEAQIQAGDISRLLKAIEKYSVPEAANPEAALAGIRIESASWIAQGRDALLRNNPEAWQTATKAAVGANVIPQTEPTRFYTNEIWDKAFRR
jgi:NitT/TauT family transport system substrate-binding protein